MLEYNGDYVLNPMSTRRKLACDCNSDGGFNRMKYKIGQTNTIL